MTFQVKNRGVPAFSGAGLERAIEELNQVCRVPKEIDSLVTTVNRIIAVLKDAEKKQISSEAVRLWIWELKQVLFDAEDLIDELATDAAVQSKGAHAYNTPTMTPGMMGQICEMNDRLDRLGPQIFTLAHQISTIQDSRPGLTTWRQTSSLLPDETPVIGRDGVKEQIIEMLTRFDESSSNNKGFSIVPIVGLGGMGKTTLAQLVFNDKKVKKHFELMMWVCVSNDLDPVRLTKDIIEAALASKGIYEQCPVNNWDSVQRRLLQEVEGKTFLLVLDDVWEAEQSWWKKLLMPLHFGKKGSKVLVTARNRAFVDKLDGRMEASIPLWGLSDDDIWVVFKKYAFRGNIKADGTTSTECSQLENWGRCIVERLEGSPLAARTIGSLLNHDLDVQHWKAVLESKFWKLEQGEDDILPALLLSYEYLSADLKLCFAYCSLFPKGHVFLKEQVVQLWEAQSFIRKGRGTRKETMGSKYFDELLHMFFFARKEYSFYVHAFLIKNAHVMHDLIHDLAEYVSKDNCFRLEDQNIVKIPNTVRHVSVSVLEMDQTDTINQLCLHDKLRTLLFLRSYLMGVPLNTNDLDQLFLKLKMLRALGLSNCQIRELPGSIGDLKHLRYIDLQWNDLVNLPESLGNLYNLQVLQLSHCEIRELPGSIGDLRHLRNISLRWNGLTRLPESLRNLCNLQVLNLSYCCIRELPGSICDLKHLRYIDLEGNFCLTRLPESLGSLYNLHVLNLSYCQIRELPVSIGDLKQLRSINLQGNNCLTGLPESLGNLDNLQVLNLRHCYSLCVLPSTMNQLVDLKHLRTDNYELASGIDGVGKLTGLHELKVRGRQVRELGGMCMLRKLMVYNLEDVGSKEEAIQARLQGMEHLQVLKLYWSEEDNRDIELNEDPRRLELEEEVLQALRPNKGIRKLHIQGYGGIKSPDWMELSTLTSFSLLRCVSLCDCPKWKAPPCSFLSQLHRLEYLKISRMPKWEEWSCPVSWDCLLELSIKHCPKLKELPLLPLTLRRLQVVNVGISGLPPELDGYIRVEGRIETTSSPHSAPTSASCENLASISVLQQQLPNLEDIEISDCKNLLNLPEKGFGHLVSLKRLWITNCPKLTYLMQQQLPNLEEIEVSNCKNLLNLPEKGFGHLISLKRLRITNCPKLTCLMQEEEIASRQHLPCSLEELEISQCGDAMSGWWWAGLQHLTSIAKLSLCGCPATVELLFLSLARHHHPYLPVTLRELLIDGYNRFDYEQQSSGALRAFTSLKVLTIWDSPSFLQNWGGCGLPSSLEQLTIDGDDNLDHKCLSAYLHDLISLKELTLAHLENLQLLPNLNALTSLEILDIERCPSMGMFGEMNLHSSLKPLTLQHLENLRSLPNLSSLTSLETLLIQSCPSIETLDLEVMSLPCSLKKLTLRECKNIFSLPNLSSLTCLQTLKIYYCPSIQSWPTSGLPSLTTLKICECPALTESFKGKLKFLCPEIVHIPDVIIDRITLRGWNSFFGR